MSGYIRTSTEREAMLHVLLLCAVSFDAGQGEGETRFHFFRFGLNSNSTEFFS